MRPRVREAIVVLSALLFVALSGSASAYAAWSPTNAAAYAERYAINPNGGYPIFSDDCTNFVSQAMRYGGHPQVGSPQPILLHDDSQWWMYGNGPSRTYSWSVADDLELFMGVHDTHADAGHLQIMGSQGNYVPSGVGRADPVLYLWDARNGSSFNHSGIITTSGTDPNSGWVGTLTDQHTTNRYHAIWNLIPYNSLWQYTTTAEFHLS
jgi:hypothetical protein